LGARKSDIVEVEVERAVLFVEQRWELVDVSQPVDAADDTVPAHTH